MSGPPAVTIADIILEVQDLGFATDTQAQQIRMVNMVQRRICASSRWPFLMTTAAATLALGANSMSFTTPNQYGYQLDSVRFADSAGNPYDTENMSPGDFDENYYGQGGLQVGQGPPQYWTIGPNSSPGVQPTNTILVFPYADQAYTADVKIKLMPAEATATTDIIQIPPQFKDVLVFGAAQYMAQRERDIYSAQFWANEFAQRMQEMKDSYKLAQTQTASHVGQSGAWDRYTNLDRPGSGVTSWG